MADLEREGGRPARGRRRVGALNLYSDRTQPWDAGQFDHARALAAVLALAARDAQQIEQRTRAMSSRTTIGQAQGILMERFGLEAEPAFAVLRRLSQTYHRRIADIAQEIVATRRLPSVSARAAGPDHDGEASGSGRGGD